MSTFSRIVPRARQRALPRLAAVFALALVAAMPAAAAEDGPAQAANWTVFLNSGSSIAATEVHFDKNQGRYSLKLPKGGYIHLSSQAVRRVSRETEDRVEKAAPVVALSTGSPTQGPVPGSIDTSGVKPPAIRSASALVSPEGSPLKERAAERMRTSVLGTGAEGSRSPQSANEAAFTPQRGMMDRLIKQRNSGPKPSRR